MEETQGLEGHQSTSRMMLHDVEAEYVVRNINKEDAQALLNDLPEDYYVVDLYYDTVKRRLEFTIFLDDVSPLGITDYYDYMENTHPECKKRFEQLHDSRTAFDDADNDKYNEDSIDLVQVQNRTLP